MKIQTNRRGITILDRMAQSRCGSHDAELSHMMQYPCCTLANANTNHDSEIDLILDFLLEAVHM